MMTKFRFNEKTKCLQYNSEKSWKDVDMEDEDNLRWMAEKLNE